MMLCVAGWRAIGEAEAAAPTAPEAPELKAQMRMPWHPPEPEYIRRWLVCGPFASPPRTEAAPERLPSGQGFDMDYLAGMGGEAAARPQAGTAFRNPDGSAGTWKPYDSPADIVDLLQALPGPQAEHVVAYAYATVRRDSPGRAALALGSDDSVKVWVNGALVHDHTVGRAVNKDEDLVLVSLEAGENAILLKVDNGIGGWGLALRVLDEGQAMAMDPGGIRPQFLPAPTDAPDNLVIETDTGLGALRPDPEPVHVEAVAPGGRVLASAEARRGGTVALNTAAWPAGPYEVRLWQRTPDGSRTVTHLPGYRGDWQAQVREILDRCDALPPGDRSAAAGHRRMLAEMILDRLGGDPRAKAATATGEAGPALQGWQAVHSPVTEWCELDLEPGAPARPYGFVRLAWLDPVDDSVQFARAYLPADYDPSRRWPMVVSLHGYNPPNPPYIQWWSVSDRHNGLAERHNVIVLEPHGRGNTSYLGIGDQDVLTAIRLAKERFRVDEDRVYLMGYSMGGGGTWHVGTRHPDLFAAIGPVFGGWDWHVWLPKEAAKDLSPRELFQLERDSSFAQAEALLTTPVFVNHGDKDELVDVEHSRYVVRMLQRWGYNIRYWEHPGGGHGPLGAEDELMRWLLAHERDRDPRRVCVRSADLKSAAAHWVRVEQRDDPLALIYVDARVADRHTIRLDTENVLQVRLSPGRELVDRRAPVRVIWNGRDAGVHALEGGAIVLRAEGYAPGPSSKTPLLAGPLSDVATTPFAIVAGTTAADPRMRAFCLLRAETQRDAWRLWQHAEPRFFLDTEITDDQVRAYSLILYGGPDENAVARRFADVLPLQLEPGSVSISGARLPAKDASAAAVCRHPLNPERYLAVVTGNSPAGMYFANRLPEQYDFAVSEPVAADEYAPAERTCVAVGCFGHNWQWDDRFVVRGDAKLLARAPRRKAPAFTSVQDAERRRPLRRLMLSELLEKRSSGSFTRMSRDLNWQAKPLKLGARTYKSGIAVQAWQEPCTGTYDIGGAWRRLRATIGIEVEGARHLSDPQKAGTRVYFVVRGDGKELYRSPTFTWDARPAEMDLDVTGVKMLELEVANEATWNNAASSVDWADIRLEK
jgi:predicted esterase